MNMFDEDQYRIAWLQMRKEEKRNPDALQNLFIGRPRGVRNYILRVMTRDMTSGDVQTALFNEYGIERSAAQISAALICLRKAGRVKMVDKIVGVVIWRRVPEKEH